jgi:hypothetical protein
MIGNAEAYTNTASAGVPSMRTVRPPEPKSKFGFSTKWWGGRGFLQKYYSLEYLAESERKK